MRFIGRVHHLDGNSGCTKFQAEFLYTSHSSLSLSSPSGRLSNKMICLATCYVRSLHLLLILSHLRVNERLLVATSGVM